MDLSQIILDNEHRIVELFNSNLTVETEPGQQEPGDHNHFYVSMFISDEDSSKCDEDAFFTTWLEPCLVALARGISELGGDVVVTELPLLRHEMSLGVLQYSYPAKAPLRFTVQYTIGHWTGKYLYNEDGSPKMVETEDEGLVHAKEYESGILIHIDTLASVTKHLTPASS